MSKQSKKFYYWSKNQHCFFTIFPDPETRIGIYGTIKATPDGFVWTVAAPDWYVADASHGQQATVEAAQKEADSVVETLLRAEFSEEWFSPLG